MACRQAELAGHFALGNGGDQCAVCRIWLARVAPVHAAIIRAAHQAVVDQLAPQQYMIAKGVCLAQARPYGALPTLGTSPLAERIKDSQAMGDSALRDGYDRRCVNS